MIDFLLHLDRELFMFCNRTLQNPVFDVFFPFLTDLNRKPAVLVVVALLMILWMIRGGRRGRVTAFLLILTIVISDQLSSFVLKFLLERPRPCQELSNIHLLVGCGSGYSFPSSHAVNTFAGALIVAYFYPRASWALLTYAVLIAFSRVYVGVHYPTDVLGGAVIGLLIGASGLAVYRTMEDWLVQRRLRGAATQ